MKAAIGCAGSGDTELACQWLAEQADVAFSDLIEATQTYEATVDAHDVSGLAAFTGCFALPRRFRTFLPRPCTGDP